MKIRNAHNIVDRETKNYLLSRMLDDLNIVGPIPLWKLQEVTRLRKECESMKPQRGDSRTRQQKKSELPPKKPSLQHLEDSDISVGFWYIVHFKGHTAKCKVLSKTPSLTTGKKNRKCIWKYSVQTKNQVCQLLKRHFIGYV